MGTRLFVGNLSYNVTEQELRDAFSGEGIEVRSVRVALDRETGRPRGFAFVETATDQDAKASIEKLSGRVLQGRGIKIEEAQARPPRDPNAPRPMGAGPRPGGFGGPPRGPGGPGGGFGGPPRGPGGPGGGFGGPPRGPGGPGGGGYGGSGGPSAGGGGPSGGGQRWETKRERPEKKRSTRPKPEERERGNWRWNGKVDED